MARQHGLEGLSARQSYNQARNQVRKRTRQLRKQYELNIANQSMSNPSFLEVCKGSSEDKNRSGSTAV